MSFLLVVGMLSLGAFAQQRSTQRGTQRVQPRVAQNQQTSPYRITGVVVSRVNGNPVPHCHLTAALTGRAGGRGMFGGNGPQMAGFAGPPGSSMRTFAGGNSGGNQTDADEHGRFTMTVPSAGAWRLVATATGFSSEAYDEHDGYSSAIVLTEQSPKMDVQFQLSPEASVNGTVLDEAGEAVRMAQVTLFRVPQPTLDGRQAQLMVRGRTQTDDRGAYEFANLPEGNYKVEVNARPWYASTARQGGKGNPLDPPLDVAYPETWYPGTDDATQATVLTLKAGDEANADLSLRPVESLHLQVLIPQPVTSADGRPMGIMMPIVERVGAGDERSMPEVSNRMLQNGQLDIDGLTPGTYQVRLQGAGAEPRTALVEVTEAGGRVVDFNAPSGEARITIHMDGAESDGSNVPVTLVNRANGQRLSSMNGGLRGREEQDDEAHGMIMEVPPGEYEVMLSGRENVYLDSMSAKNAEVKGRLLKLQSGDATLTLHVREGRASVSGIVRRGAEPLEGAMVLLVPAGLDDPAAMTALARDQSNTDGSFDLPAVVPGQYILVAIDKGWQVNWRDALTLNHYLTQGVPLELGGSARVKQDLVAQTP